MTEPAFLKAVLKGNEGAILFCRLLFDVSQVWDDLIDGDKPVDASRINDAFIAALLRLPSLAFFQENYASLYPVMQVAVYDWLAANAMEKGNEHDKTVAFVLRDSLTAIVTQCAYIVGGHEYAIEVSPAVRRYFHDEPLSEYLGDHP